MVHLLTAVLLLFASFAGAALPMRRSHCDLDSFEKLPRLLLIGEDHGSGHSYDVKRHAARLGAKGRLFVALEVGAEHAFFPWELDELHHSFALPRMKVSRLFPVESPFPHGLIGSYILAAPSPSNRGFALAEFMAHARRNPYARRCWEEVSASPLEHALRPMALRIDAALATSSDASYLHGDEEAAFNLLMRRFNARYVALAKSLYSPELGGKLLRQMPSVGPSWSLEGVTAVWEKIVAQGDRDFVIMVLRDRDLGENIADVYCAAAAEGRNIAAGVGNGHISGIHKLLMGWSADRIPIEVADSHKISRPIIDRLDRLADEPLAPRPLSPHERVADSLRSIADAFSR